MRSRRSCIAMSRREHRRNGERHADATSASTMCASISQPWRFQTSSRPTPVTSAHNPAIGSGGAARDRAAAYA